MSITSFDVQELYFSPLSKPCARTQILSYAGFVTMNSLSTQCGIQQVNSLMSTLIKYECLFKNTLGFELDP